MKNLKTFLPPSLALIFFLTMWHYIVSFGLVANYLLPTPEQVFLTGKELSSEIFSALISTTLASAVGFLASFVFGLSLSVILSSSRPFSKWLKSAVLPFAVFFQTVPIVAIAPLLVIWFGFGTPTVISAAFIVSFFPMLANCLMGFSMKNRELEEMLESLNASVSQKFFYLQLPLALPSILSGLKISAGLSVVGALVGEFVAGGGLGGLIDSARTQQRVDLVFASLIMSSMVGFVFVSLVDLLNYILLAWRPFYQRLNVKS